jgi:two-component system, response regulator
MSSDETEVLLVEDSQNQSDLTLHAWQRENLAHHLTAARPGEDSLELRFCRGGFGGGSIEQLSRLIPLGLRLPGVDGIGTLKQIKSDDRPKRIPVVILTSPKKELDLVNGYIPGANRCLQKPVDFPQFRRSLTTLASYWLLRNRPAVPNSTQRSAKRAR